jgi:hypothetical protein
MNFPRLDINFHTPHKIHIKSPLSNFSVFYAVCSIIYDSYSSFLFGLFPRQFLQCVDLLNNLLTNCSWGFEVALHVCKLCMLPLKDLQLCNASLKSQLQHYPMWVDNTIPCGSTTLHSTVPKSIVRSNSYVFVRFSGIHASLFGSTTRAITWCCHKELESLLCS